MKSRRTFLQSAITTAASLAAATRALASAQRRAMRPASPAKAASDAFRAPVPVITPDVKDAPYRVENGVKVFHLIAEPVKRKIAPWKTIDCWGFNGSSPGPTIQVNQGDRVRVVVENHLPEATAIHWHGLEVPYAMDGMPYISQRPIAPGSRYVYEFTIHQNGTFFYHSHSPMQQMMGMVGMVILHPSQAHTPVVDHDFGIVLQEWAVLPNNTVPNTANMEWNWLTFNGVVSPMTTPLIVRLGSRVRIRLVNIGMDHHPVHLHGHTFVVTGTEAGRQPETTWGPANTVLVGVAQARDVEFMANNPGEWMLHCHMPHHNMNSMTDLLGGGLMTTADTEDARALSQMQTLADRAGFVHVHHAPIAPDANQVPGFPQDAFMDMGMDEAVAKPENNGLPRNWSAMMMGMMTLVRVLPPELYERMMEDVRHGYVAPLPALEGHSHPHEGGRQ